MCKIVIMGGGGGSGIQSYEMVSVVINDIQTSVSAVRELAN